LWPGTPGFGHGIAPVALALGVLDCFHFTKYLRVISLSCGSARPRGNARFG
jgi:hypothetical protein